MNHQLVLAANLPEADHFYEALIDSHRNLSEADSAAFNARLILVLANHIGQLDVLLQALKAAAHEGRVPAD
jgi:hypothetical protein